MHHHQEHIIQLIDLLNNQRNRMNIILQHYKIQKEFIEHFKEKEPLQLKLFKVKLINLEIVYNHKL